MERCSEEQVVVDRKLDELDVVVITFVRNREEPADDRLARTRICFDEGGDAEIPVEQRGDKDEVVLLAVLERIVKKIGDRVRLMALVKRDMRCCL